MVECPAVVEVVDTSVVVVVPARAVVEVVTGPVVAVEGDVTGAAVVAVVAGAAALVN